MHLVKQVEKFQQITVNVSTLSVVVQTGLDVGI
jgi:hypothetical protein